MLDSCSTGTYVTKAAAAELGLQEESQSLTILSETGGAMVKKRERSQEPGEKRGKRKKREEREKKEKREKREKRKKRKEKRENREKSHDRNTEFRLQRPVVTRKSSIKYAPEEWPNNTTIT